MTTRSRARIGKALPALLLVVAGVPAPALAQVDTGVVRAVSTWQRDVDRLIRQLMEQRRIEVEFQNMLLDLEGKMRSRMNDSLRNWYEAQSALVSRRLKQAGSEQIRLRATLESKCSSVRTPSGWLGVAITAASAADLQPDGHAVVRYLESPLVASVDPGSPAERVGIRSGDVIVEVGGEPLLNHDVVFAELLRPGQRVEVKVRRGREIVALKPLIEAVPASVDRQPCSWVDASTAYVLSPVPGSSGFSYRFSVDSSSSRLPIFIQPPMPRDEPQGMSVVVGAMGRYYSGGVNPIAGLTLVPMNEDLGETAGVNSGLFVVEVLPGTPGKSAGLRGGDVIVSANDIELRSTNTLQRVIQQADSVVTLVIVRGKKQQKLALRWSPGRE